MGERKVERNYHRFQINKKMFEYLLKMAEQKGYKAESYDSFAEIFGYWYTQKIGTMRISTKGVITYIFCDRSLLVDFAEEYNAPWEVKCDNVIFEYYRTEPNDTSDTNTSHTTGQSAWRSITSQIKKRYTEEEIIEILKQRQVEAQPNILRNSIYSRTITRQNVILEYDNCVYYDLNKAYAAMTIEAFPKLSKWVMSQYKKNKPKMKKTMNYFVGMMVNKVDYLQENIFPYFRNYIVNRVTGLMNEAIEQVTIDEHMSFIDTEILYANTDGFIISNPLHDIETSQTELGKFKKEQIDDGKVWFYKHNNTCVSGITNELTDANYSIFQYFENGEKVIKVIGGFRTDEALLEKTDLSKGIIPIFGLTDVAGIKEINKESIVWQTIQIEK